MFASLSKPPQIRTIEFVKFFLIVSVLPFTIQGAKPSNHNQIQKKDYSRMLDEDYPSVPTSPAPTGGCSRCKNREELKDRNLAIIKEEILKRMGFSQPPNITGKVLPQVPAHYLAQIEEEHGMQGDQSYKLGVTFTEEDDDFHVRTQKVLTWAESYPRLRHSWKANDILHFPFSDSITKFHVANSTLNFYVRGSDRRSSQQDIVIEIYKVLKPGDRSDPPSLIKVANWKEPQPMGRGKWLQADLTETVGEWFKNERENFGFVINATVNGKKVAVTDVNTEKSKAPYVETSVTEPKRRKRRNSGLNCDEKSNEPLCCRYSFVVDFVEIGLDFIVAPKRYDAHMCSGECQIMTLQKYPHTHLVKMSQPNTAAPCCAPRKMSPMSMLYFDEKTNVVLSSLPGMVVDRCGCS
ncbi:growth/differentiation factor 8 [Euwallacea fornicatus]|uniref:growth/differentiation factor 8 n=1 Tax=Euwallacea fornicatus TaxID=995702 RepID=UPI00338F65D5